MYRLMLRGLFYFPRFTRRGIELHTPRLLLREWEPEDWEPVFAYRSDPRVREYDLTPAETEQEVKCKVRIRHGVRMLYPSPDYVLALALKPEGRVIGEIGLFPLPSGRRALMGFMLHQEYWNRGLATEAASALLDWAFRVGRYSTVLSMCHPDNVGSWRVMEKVGMRRLDRRPKLKFQDGSVIESLQYEITREDWLRRTPPPVEGDTEIAGEQK
jgi:RimJ/RimL family protein N-acetyltransferase